MLSKRILFIALIVAAACAFVPPPPTFGCIPADDGTCIAVKPAQVQAATPQIEASTLNRPVVANRAGLKKNLTEFVNSRPSAEPPIDNPTAVDTTAPQDTWVHIGPHKTVWFEVTDAVKRLAVSVNAHKQPGLSLLIYSPEQHDVFRDEEIGRGTRKDGYDLWWSGSVRENGKWFIKLKNENDISVPYNLVTRTATDSGSEYRPNVSYAFGTGEIIAPAAAKNAKPVAPANAPSHAPAAAHVPVAIPGSPDPFTAPVPSGQQVHIGPHATVWYKASDRKRRLNIWMQADRNLGLVMAVYGPDIQDVWHAKPTGVGAPDNGFPYFWTGRAKFKGDWRIRITNPNDFSVPYTLNAANVSDKAGDLCRDCHGGIGDDQFDKCEHDGSFCDDLRDEAGS